MAQQTEGKYAETNEIATEILTDYFLENDVPTNVRKAFNSIRKRQANVSIVSTATINARQPKFKPWVKYFITGPNGKCVHLDNGVDANGAAITQWDKANLDNHKWYISPVFGDDGYYHIINVKTGRILHNHGGTNQINKQCTTWRMGPEPNLRVRFQIVDDENYNKDKNNPIYWFIIFKDSGKCVHNKGGGNSNGAQITQYRVQKSHNLYWRFDT